MIYGLTLLYLSVFLHVQHQTGMKQSKLQLWLYYGYRTL